MGTNIFSRELMLVLSIAALGSSWLMLPDGTYRNVGIALSTATVLYLLLSSSTDPNVITTTVDTTPENDVTEETIDETEINNPSLSLDACLRVHRILNHPASISLQTRIDEYRRIVLLVAKERSGQGSLWKNPDNDTRTRSCLCGTLTREELLKSLELEEVAKEPPRVGAGMGIEPILANISKTRGTIIAEDGKPANRILRDPVVDNLINVLSAHRPEARQDLLMARERYVENVLRRLVGPLDDRGRPIVPLCSWQKRFDGDHFKNFEELERTFQGI